jgi:BirA family transcriptional regulator, biotin operon repressor / biotin---[acetyl-CoA-carboxylase] ligase
VLDSDALTALVVSPTSTWRRVDVVAETGSTNADLIARATSGEDIVGTVLVAGHQTAGRGRNGRTWSALPGAQLTVSVGVSPDDMPTTAWGWIPLAAGVAVVEAVAAATGVEVGLKWPNDVLGVPPGAPRGQGKVAGILAEVTTPRPVVVIGIGINVSMGADELPDPGATSLSLLGADAPDRSALLVELLDALQRRMASLRSAGGLDPVLAADYAARSLTIGAHVRATLPGEGEIVGEAIRIDEQGRLCIDTGAEVIAVSAGDIVHLRPLGGHTAR